MATKRKLKSVEFVNVEPPLEFVGKHFTTHHLKSFNAATDKQHEVLISYFQNQTTLIAQVGSAGTGKTLTAFYCGLSDVLDSSTPYDKLIIIRSAVQTRDIGYLKGTEEEKNAAYERAYSGICDQLMTFKSKNYQNMKDNGVIQFENTSFLRGTTFNNCVVIFDEIQSATFHELMTVLTRVGKDCRILLCGDFKQNDLHKKGDVSGFLQVMTILGKMDPSYVKVIEYTTADIVRSGFVKELLITAESCGI